MADAGGPDALAMMLGGAEEMGPEGGAEDEYTEAFQGAAVAAMQAWEAGDEAAFATNLKDAIEICFEDKEGKGDEMASMEGMI
tara:strand:- start:956 stop:1204 length:249 start_codon:yes stop_codon:yes gene_type:complete